MNRRKFLQVLGLGSLLPFVPETPIEDVCRFGGKDEGWTLMMWVRDPSVADVVLYKNDERIGKETPVEKKFRTQFFPELK